MLAKFIFVMGSSGSGKSTISEELVKIVQEHGQTVAILGLDKKEIRSFCEDSINYSHTHNALDDAVECAYYYLKLRLLMKKYTLVKNT